MQCWWILDGSGVYTAVCKYLDSPTYSIVWASYCQHVSWKDQDSKKIIIIDPTNIWSYKYCLCIQSLVAQWCSLQFDYIVCSYLCFFNSADVNPEHHVRILEALITTGGLMEMQAAPGRIITMHINLFHLHTPYAYTLISILWHNIVQYDLAWLWVFCDPEKSHQSLHSCCLSTHTHAVHFQMFLLSDKASEVCFSNVSPFISHTGDMAFPFPSPLYH